VQDRDEHHPDRLAQVQHLLGAAQDLPRVARVRVKVGGTALLHAHQERAGVG
jgi:hypothetical protein